MESAGIVGVAGVATTVNPLRSGITGRIVTAEIVEEEEGPGETPIFDLVAIHGLHVFSDGVHMIVEAICKGENQTRTFHRVTGQGTTDDALALPR